MQIYVVKQGDNVDGIAAEFGISAGRLIADNQIEYPYRLAVGQALLIDDETESGGFGGPADRRPPLETNGYAYPFIERQILENTLPYLTDLSVFSYGFTEEGELVPPAVDDTWMIREAIATETRPLLVLTPLGGDGRFNNNLITKILRNLDAQQRLLRSLWQTVHEKNYGGVDVDFEYIRAEDRVLYAEFVTRVRVVLNLYGYKVTVALAPKTSRDQRGLLYEGMDYRLLGEAANQAMLMTYEWGYTYGPPMAVAPINMVRRVVEFAVTEIDPDKISLGIPNYGYDWPLPFEQGVTKARSLGNHEAVQMAVDYGVEIYFDEMAQTPYFRYWQYGIQHEVWFEDVRSLQAKYDLIKEFGLHGAGIWQIMRFFLPGWLLMQSQFRITKDVREGTAEGGGQGGS